MKRIFQAVLLLTFTWISHTVTAAFSIEYQAPADPTTAGFSAVVLVPPVPQVTEPIADDLGYPAWSIAGLDFSSQFGYQSGPLSATQKTDINNEGFTLTLRVRPLQGNAPAYDAGSNTVIGGVILDIGSRRYDFVLGINSNGNTVAVLLTSLDGFGPGDSVRGFGPNYTLNDADYHTYDLVFDPDTQSASLLIDGVERISGYTGHSQFLNDRGLAFVAASGGGMNFNLVRLTSPAASSTTLTDTFTRDLMALWNFEDKTGTVVHNAASSSNNLDGLFQGTGLSFEVGGGKVGDALRLPGGAGNYVDVINKVIPDGSPSYTWSAWFRRDTNIGAGYILESDPNFALSAVTLDGNIVRTHIQGASGDYRFRDDYVTLTDWNLITVTYDEAQGDDLAGSVYINGVFTGHVDLLNADITPLAPTTGLHIGASRDGGAGIVQGFDGLLDEVAVWTRVLTPTEIKLLYNNGNGVDILASLFGDSLKISSSYEFSVEQGTQQTDSIQLVNSSDVSQSATLEIINSHPELTISLPQDSVTIAPGATENLPLQIDATSAAVGIYEGILLEVAVDDGSTLYSNITVYVTEPGARDLPDLTIHATDIRSTTNADGSITLTANIQNRGPSPASNVEVQFYEFGNLLGETVIAEVPANGITSTSLTVPSLSSGDHLVQVIVDPAGMIPELDEDNNEASQIIHIGDTGEAEGNILVTGSLPSTVYTDSLFTLTGQAVYAINVNGTTNTDYVVKGGLVDVTIKADDGTEWVYGGIHTDINGDIRKSLQAPATPGTYRLSMTVTDQTFSGTRELVFSVTEPPPAGSTPPPPPPTTTGTGTWSYDAPSGTWIWTWTTLPVDEPTQSDLRVFSEDIHFSKNHPDSNEEITIFAAIHYWATSTDLLAHDVPVNLYVTEVTSTSPQKIKIGQTTMDSLSVGGPDFGSRYVYATWKNTGEGIYLVEVEIDPSYVEEYLLNNAATRAIVVGQIPSGLGAISGQATDALGGVGNVMIHVLDASGTELGSTLTDSTGFYLVEDVPLGDIQVRIDPPSGYQPDALTKAVTVSDQAVSTVDFQLTRQGGVPVANAGENLTITSEEQCGTVIQGSASDPDNDSLQYRWLEGGTEIFPWTAVGSNGEAYLDLCDISLGLGQHTLTLEVSDGQTTSSDEMILTLDNSAPNAAPTGGGVYSLGTLITVGGQVSDFDGDWLTYTWSEGGATYCNGQVQSVEGGTPVSLPGCDLPSLELGTHMVTLTISDDINEPVSRSITIEVVDTTAPTLAPEPNVGILWPPNHKMVDIIIQANASDDSGLPPMLSAEVTSNEPQEGLGDGDVAPDWTTPVIDQATGEITLQLRAERSGLGEGRIYTVSITATDEAGNTSTANVEIIVPHDQGKK